MVLSNSPITRNEFWRFKNTWKNWHLPHKHELATAVKMYWNAKNGNSERMLRKRFIGTTIRLQHYSEKKTKQINIPSCLSMGNERVRNLALLAFEPKPLKYISKLIKFYESLMIRKNVNFNYSELTKIYRVFELLNNTSCSIRYNFPLQF